jgi:hypothetical protein
MQGFNLTAGIWHALHHVFNVILKLDNCMFCGAPLAKGRRPEPGQCMGPLRCRNKCGDRTLYDHRSRNDNHPDHQKLLRALTPAQKALVNTHRSDPAARKVAIAAAELRKKERQERQQGDKRLARMRTNAVHELQLHAQRPPRVDRRRNTWDAYDAAQQRRAELAGATERYEEFEDEYLPHGESTGRDDHGCSDHGEFAAHLSDGTHSDYGESSDDDSSSTNSTHEWGDDVEGGGSLADASSYLCNEFDDDRLNDDREQPDEAYHFCAGIGNLELEPEPDSTDGSPLEPHAKFSTAILFTDPTMEQIFIISPGPGQSYNPFINQSQSYLPVAPEEGTQLGCPVAPSNHWSGAGPSPVLPGGAMAAEDLGITAPSRPLSDAVLQANLCMQRTAYRTLQQDIIMPPGGWQMLTQILHDQDPLIIDVNRASEGQPDTHHVALWVVRFPLSWLQGLAMPKARNALDPRETMDTIQPWQVLAGSAYYEGFQNMRAMTDVTAQGLAALRVEISCAENHESSTNDTRPLLAELQMTQYHSILYHNEVDLAALQVMETSDLQELGIPDDDASTILRVYGLMRRFSENYRDELRLVHHDGRVKRWCTAEQMSCAPSQITAAQTVPELIGHDKDTSADGEAEDRDSSISSDSDSDGVETSDGNFHCNRAVKLQPKAVPTRQQAQQAQLACATLRRKLITLYWWAHKESRLDRPQWPDLRMSQLHIEILALMEYVNRHQENWPTSTAQRHMDTLSRGGPAADGMPVQASSLQRLQQDCQWWCHELSSPAASCEQRVEARYNVAFELASEFRTSADKDHPPRPSGPRSPDLYALANLVKDGHETGLFWGQHQRDRYLATMERHPYVRIRCEAALYGTRFINANPGYKAVLCLLGAQNRVVCPLPRVVQDTMHELGNPSLEFAVSPPMRRKLIRFENTGRVSSRVRPTLNTIKVLQNKLDSLSGLRHVNRRTWQHLGTLTARMLAEHPEGWTVVQEYGFQLHSCTHRYACPLRLAQRAALSKRLSTLDSAPSQPSPDQDASAEMQELGTRRSQVRPFQRLLLAATESRGADCHTATPLVRGPHLPLSFDLCQLVQGHLGASSSVPMDEPFGAAFAWHKAQVPLASDVAQPLDMTLTQLREIYGDTQPRPGQVLCLSDNSVTVSKLLLFDPRTGKVWCGLMDQPHDEFYANHPQSDSFAHQLNLPGEPRQHRDVDGAATILRSCRSSLDAGSDVHRAIHRVATRSSTARHRRHGHDEFHISRNASVETTLPCPGQGVDYRLEIWIVTADSECEVYWSPTDATWRTSPSKEQPSGSGLHGQEWRPLESFLQHSWYGATVAASVWSHIYRNFGIPRSPPLVDSLVLDMCVGAGLIQPVIREADEQGRFIESAATYQQRLGEAVAYCQRRGHTAALERAYSQGRLEPVISPPHNWQEVHTDTLRDLRSPPIQGAVDTTPTVCAMPFVTVQAPPTTPSHAVADASSGDVVHPRATTSAASDSDHDDSSAATEVVGNNSDEVWRILRDGTSTAPEFHRAVLSMLGTLNPDHCSAYRHACPPHAQSHADDRDTPALAEVNMVKLNKSHFIHPTGVTGQMLLDGGSTATICTPDHAVATGAIVDTTQRGSVKLANNTRAGLAGIIRNHQITVDGVLLTLPLVFVMGLFPGVDLLMGMDCGRQFAIVHHMRENVAIGYTDSSRSRQYFVLCAPEHRDGARVHLEEKQAAHQRQNPELFPESDIRPQPADTARPASSAPSGRPVPRTRSSTAADAGRSARQPRTACMHFDHIPHVGSERLQPGDTFDLGLAAFSPVHSSQRSDPDMPSGGRTHRRERKSGHVNNLYVSPSVTTRAARRDAAAALAASQALHAVPNSDVSDHNVADSANEALTEEPDADEESETEGIDPPPPMAAADYAALAEDPALLVLSVRRHVQTHRTRLQRECSTGLRQLAQDLQCATLYSQQCRHAGSARTVRGFARFVAFRQQRIADGTRYSTQRKAQKFALREMCGTASTLAQMPDIFGQRVAVSQLVETGPDAHAGLHRVNLVCTRPVHELEAGQRHVFAAKHGTVQGADGHCHIHNEADEELAPIWYGDDEQRLYQQSQFEPCVVGSPATMRKLRKRAGVSKKSAIFGDTSCPGVFLVEHQTVYDRATRTQQPGGYTVVYDKRFIDHYEKDKAESARVAAVVATGYYPWSHYELQDMHQYNKDQHEAVVLATQLSQAETRLDKVTGNGQGQLYGPSLPVTPNQAALADNTVSAEPRPSDLIDLSTAAGDGDQSVTPQGDTAVPPSGPISPAPEEYHIQPPDGGAVHNAHADQALLNATDVPLRGHFASLPGIFLDGSQLHQLQVDNPKTADKPKISWTPAEVEKYGVRLKLKPGCEAPPIQARRLGVPMLKIVNEQLKELLDAGIICRESSPTGAPLMCVPKPKRPTRPGEPEEPTKYRAVVDYRLLNRVLTDTSHPTPNLADVIAAIRDIAVSTHREDQRLGIPADRADATADDPKQAILSSLDWSRAFHSLPVHPTSRWLTCFVVPQSGSYTWM